MRAATMSRLINWKRGVALYIRLFESRRAALGLVEGSSDAMMARSGDTAVSLRPMLVGGSCTKQRAGEGEDDDAMRAWRLSIGLTDLWRLSWWHLMEWKEGNEGDEWDCSLAWWIK